jgi:hypothetical protein
MADEMPELPELHELPETPRSSITGMVIAAGAVTLAVTLVRLAGELQGWDPAWFGRDAGGQGAVLGIVWLVPVFGFLVGRRLARIGRASPVPVRALALLALAVAALLGGAGYVSSSLQGEELRTAVRYLAIGAPLLVLAAIWIWPAGVLANLAYGVLARAPVVVVQYVSIARAWGTHYEKVHPALPPMTADERAFGLMLAQATLWVPFTALVGALCAVLGAMTVRGRPAP